MKTIERLMNESRPLAERLSHKLSGVALNARKLGVEHIGGLGGFRMAFELTALKTALKELEDLFR